MWFLSSFFLNDNFTFSGEKNKKNKQTKKKPLYLVSHTLFECLAFPSGSLVKTLRANAGDKGLIPGSGGSPGEGNDNPLQYSCLENPMDGGAWWATVHVGTKELDTT